MKRKIIKGIFSASMDSNAKPVIENSNLNLMPDINQKHSGNIKNAPKGKGFMPLKISGKYKGSKKSITEGIEMAPFDRDNLKKIKMDVPEFGYQEQVPKISRKKTDSGYMVLRMRVQNGEISVIGSRRSEGPLLETDYVTQSGITYEAFVNDSRISIGSIPDYGEQRSFARPEGDPSHEGHHITILPSFEFNAKIPLNRLSLKELPKLKVYLYRFKENVDNFQLTRLPLSEQFPREIRVVGELNGIHTERLHKEVKDSLKRTFIK